MESSMTSDQEPRKMGLAEARRAQEEARLSEQRRLLSSTDAVRNILTYSLAIGYAQTVAKQMGKVEEFKRVVGEANSVLHMTGPGPVMDAVRSVIGDFTVPPEWQIGSGETVTEL